MGTMDRVTVFLRYESTVLLHRGPAGWDGLTRVVGADPAATARAVVDETVPSVVDAVVEGTGDPVSLRDGADRWRRHPFIVDMSGREVDEEAISGPAVWTSPTTLREYGGAPGAWRAYRAVGPSVATVRGDTRHGSRYVSLRALEALRDRAVDVAAGGRCGRTDGELDAYARKLATSRPSLVAVGVRVDRVMGTEPVPTGPRAIATRCQQVIASTIAADEAAAARVTARIADRTVLTLSRSATVITALTTGEPAAVWVLESRPAREGIPTAETLSEGEIPVTVVVDAAASHVLERRDIDAVLVGVDAIGPRGTVSNKVGTRTVARAATAADVPMYAVASTDKVSPTPLHKDEAGPTGPVYDGDHPVRVSYPLFDRTPAEAITAVLTEEGPLESPALAAVAARHRKRRRWRRGRST